jgi:hypothetical protein
MPELHFWEVAYANKVGDKNDGVVPDAPCMVIEPDSWDNCVRCILQDELIRGQYGSGPEFADLLTDTEAHYGLFTWLVILEHLDRFAVKTGGGHLGDWPGDGTDYNYIRHLDCKASDLFYYVNTMLEMIEFCIGRHEAFRIRHNTYELPDEDDETVDSGA